MSRRRFGSAGVLLFFLLGCASGGAHVESATAPGADIAAYASFGWLPASESAEGAAERPLSIGETNLYAAIRKQLIERGYREVEASPDFRIGFETAPHTQEKTSRPFHVGIGVGSWGGNVGGGVSTSVPVGSERVTTTAETRITIRAVDVKSNREVWLGSATRDVQEGLDAGVVEKAVAEVMEEFPERRR
jgi:hypothetical protein